MKRQWGQILESQEKLIRDKWDSKLDELHEAKEELEQAKRDFDYQLAAQKKRNKKQQLKDQQQELVLN